MYHYEQILEEHRQRVARGVRNYDRLRVAAERIARKVVSEPNPRESVTVDEGVSSETETETVLESDPRLESTASVR